MGKKQEFQKKISEHDYIGAMELAISCGSIASTDAESRFWAREVEDVARFVGESLWWDGRSSPDWNGIKAKFEAFDAELDHEVAV